MGKSSNFFKRKAVNIDISNLCALECPRCQRQFNFRDHGLPVPGENIDEEDFQKVVNFFEHIDFEGQYSDPVHHPNFIKMLKKCYAEENSVEIHNGSSVKPKKWYIEAFKANPDAYWVFSIDGLPEESHKYRINQDGDKLFNIMLESKKYLSTKPRWQYIVFSYNESNIEKARNIAQQEGIFFCLLQSARWNSHNDELIPSEKYAMSKK